MATSPKKTFENSCFSAHAAKDPDGLDILKSLGRSAREGWDEAAFEIIDSPIGREYQKMGVHPEQVPAYSQTINDWVLAGSKAEAKPGIEDYTRSVVQQWMPKQK